MGGALEGVETWGAHLCLLFSPKLQSQLPTSTVCINYWRGYDGWIGDYEWMNE